MQHFLERLKQLHQLTQMYYVAYFRLRWMRSSCSTVQQFVLINLCLHHYYFRDILQLFLLNPTQLCPLWSWEKTQIFTSNVKFLKRDGCGADPKISKATELFFTEFRASQIYLFALCFLKLKSYFSEIFKEFPPPPSPPERYQFSLPLFSDLIHYRLWITAFIFRRTFATMVGSSTVPRRTWLTCHQGRVAKQGPFARWSGY